MVKKVCLISLVLLCLGVGLFNQTIQLAFFKWTAESYSKQVFGQSLLYKSAYLHQGKLILQSPYLSNHYFQADQVVIGCEWDLWKREVYLNIDLVHPCWLLKDEVVKEWQKWQNMVEPDEGWLKVHSAVHVQEGKILWDSPSQELSFDLEANSRSGGTLTAYLDPDNHSKNYFVLQALAAADAMHACWDCQQVDAPAVMRLAKTLFSDLKEWNLSAGVLSGRIEAIFLPAARPYLEGELLIDGLAVSRQGSLLAGKVQRAKIKLQKNQAIDQEDGRALTTVGEMAILEPASLYYQGLGSQDSWAIDQIQGQVNINGSKQAEVSLEAQGCCLDQQSHFSLQGLADLNAQHKLHAKLTLFCSSLGQPNSKISFHLQETDKQKEITIQLKKLSCIECQFLQKVLAVHWPQTQDVQLQKGLLDGSLVVYLTDKGLENIHFKQFQFDDLQFKFSPWGVSSSLKCAKGHGILNLGVPNIWESINGELHLDDGQVILDGLEPHLPLTSIQSHLQIKNGTIPNGIVAVQFAGLKGTMGIEWQEEKENIEVQLEGKMKDLGEHLPACLLEGLHNQLSSHQLKILANIKRQPHQQLELVGDIHIWQGHAEKIHQIRFGGELKKVIEYSGNRFKPVGWFYAKDLPLDKFVSPFIFRQGVLSMRGKAEVKGALDDYILTINYDVEDLALENEDLLIEAKQLRSPIPSQFIGLHQFDLKKRSQQGVLPLQQASYLEKNSGLYFSDIQGKVLFEGQMIQIRSMQAYCQDVYFAGSLNLDYSDPAPGVFKLQIESPQFSGRASQIRYLLSHFNPSPLNQLHLEGDINGRESGMKLAFEFFPGDYHLQADVRGSLANGSLPFESQDMSLKGLFLDIDYQHDKHCLTLTDIQGVLLVGKPKRVKEFTFAGSRIVFGGKEGENIYTDIWVKDGEQELLRLVAEANTSQGIKEIHLNPVLSHISQIYPSRCVCQMKTDGTLQAFEYESYFELKPLVNDLGRFKQTGLLGLSPTLLAKLDPYDQLSGSVHFKVHYDPLDKGYSYSLESDNIRTVPDASCALLLKGKKRDKRWIIDHFQWNQLNFFADLYQGKDKWKVNFLGINDGESIVVGLEGDFIPELGKMEANLKLCDIQLAQLGKWPFLRDLINQWNPQGLLQLKGKLKVSFLEDSLWNGLEASFITSLKDASVRKFSFEMAGPFKISIQQGQSVALEEINASLYGRTGQLGVLSLKKCLLHCQQAGWQCTQLSFNIPSQQLVEFASSLHQCFPEWLDEENKEILASAKKEGSLSGKLDWNRRVDSQEINLTLEDGLYFFKKREYDLSNFKTKIEGSQLKFSALTHQERCPFQLAGTIQWPELNRGEFQLVDCSSQVAPSLPLTIEWQKHPQRGFLIDRLNGYFCGMDFQLVYQPVDEPLPDWTVMKGTLSLDFNRLCPLLSSTLAETVERLKLGSCYYFDGIYWMNPDIGSSLLDTIFFKGKIASQGVIIKGYQFDHLEAELDYQPKRLEMNEFVLEDQSGKVYSSQMVLVEDDRTQDWFLYMPRLTVKNFRPSLLRDVETGALLPSKFKTLLVKRIDIDAFQGNLNDIQTWQASGRFHFLNPSRKNLAHPLLAIPAEIILRLGLDPQVLNPVTGTLFFDLKGDRFYFTRFKDVYSEGRGSKFYLANSPTPSWMDMDGNLSVQIRMKQYNLIFKIAELFTVSIQGHLKKPKYQLQKQAKGSRKGGAIALFNK